MDSNRFDSATTDDADALLLTLFDAEVARAPARVRFGVFQAMAVTPTTTVQINDEVIAEAPDQDVADLVDDGYARLRDPFLDLTGAGRERARRLRQAVSEPNGSSAGETVASTWAWRELAFLREAIPRVDDGQEPGLTELATAAGITVADARAAANALENSHPPFVTLSWVRRGGGPPQHGMVTQVHERGRRAVGQWPSADA